MGRKMYILIVTYNAIPWLPLCCHKAEELPEGWGIIVVDNASTDGTADVLEKEYPHIHLIRGKENLGFGRANNLGMRYALEQGADYLYLMNQDSTISIQDIAELARLHEAHPECWIVSPVQYNGEGTALDYSFADFCAASGPDVFLNRQGAHELPKLVYADWGIAAGWLLPQSTLTAIGGFSPLFLHYGEDEDFVNRVRFHGGKIGIAANVAMRHHRKRRLKRKPFSDRFLDRLMRMADPAQKAAPPTRVLRFFAGPLLRQLVSGNTSKAAFLMRACLALMPGDAPGSIRDAVRNKGAAFL